MGRLLAIYLLFSSISLGGQDSLIPYPKILEFQSGQLELEQVHILCPQKIRMEASSALHSLRLHLFASGFPEVRIRNKDQKKIRFSIGLVGESRSHGAYQLVVSQKGVWIQAQDGAGLFYGVQTLRQLWRTRNGRLIIPCCRIVDWPAFQVRGFMFDVGRNFQTISRLKEQVEIFASYKLNVFHWHLTDHPAWRIQSLKYPQLNDPKNHRPGRDPGKFYTYEEIRDFIGYCRLLHITVIPEIDMPGHSQYFEKAFGFRMETPQGMEVLKRCLQEFFDQVSLEDTPIFHLGSDEVHIKDPKGFISEMAGFVRNSGRRVAIWSPGLKGDKEIIYQYWGGGRIPNPDTLCMDSTGGYLNSVDPLNCVSRYFFQQICRRPHGDRNAMGAILCAWPDVRVDIKDNIYRHNPIYPGMLAFSHAVWAGRKAHHSDHAKGLPFEENQALKEFQSLEARVLDHGSRFFSQLPFPFVKHSHIVWRLHPDDKDSEEWIPARGGAIKLNPERFKNKTVYARTWIHSPKDQTVGFWVGFETPFRANRQYNGIPEKGSWDVNGGMVWVNHQPLAPPEWKQPGKFNNAERPCWGSPKNEIPYTDEEFYWTRKETFAPLNKGWNTVLIKVPRGKHHINWMFAFAPTEDRGLGFSINPD